MDSRGQRGHAPRVHHRTWFHFSVEGCDVGETLTFTFVDYNKQKTLFSNDFRPVYRVHGSMRSYQRVKFPVTSHLRDDGQFRFSFKHRFASSRPAYFAFSFPFGYHDAVAMLDNVDARFADPTHGPPLRERVWWTRETLARSVEGRSVEMVTVTDPEGMDPARAPGSVRVPEGRQVFVVTCGVHPGEKPANHMLQRSRVSTPRGRPASRGASQSVRLSRRPHAQPGRRLPRPLPRAPPGRI